MKIIAIAAVTAGGKTTASFKDYSISKGKKSTKIWFSWRLLLTN